MKVSILAIALVTALSLAAEPQVLNLQSLDRLGSKATDSININLDASLLKLASGFLSDDGDQDVAALKKVVGGIRGISIRHFEFKSDAEYAAGDVESIRSQLRDSTWKRIVEVRSKTGGDADIFLKMLDGKVAGLALIAAEPKELTVVSIDGPIDLEGLQKLSGNFGIPKSVGKKAVKPDGKAK